MLRNLGVDKYNLDGISQKQQEHYAAIIRRRRPSKARELRERRLDIALLCYLRIAI